MASKDLMNYIKDQLISGHKIDVIINALLTSNKFTKQEVDKAVEQVFANEYLTSSEDKSRISTAKNHKYSILAVLLILAILIDICLVFFAKNSGAFSKFTEFIKNKIFFQPLLSGQTSPKKIVNTTQKNTTQLNIIKPQIVNNVGYSFALAQIDYENAPPPSDEIKNAITSVIYKAQFPQKLLNNLTIVIVNTLSIEKTKKIQLKTGIVSIPDFSPDFLTGGGIYTQTKTRESVIFLNSKKVCSTENYTIALQLGMPVNNQLKCAISDTFLSKVLTHELAHFIEKEMTTEEWNKYYMLRSIPSGTPIRLEKWQLSPEEDFAEVYANIFAKSNIDTYYGVLHYNKCGQEEPCQYILDNLMKVYDSAHPTPTLKYDLKEGFSQSFLEQESYKKAREDYIVKLEQNDTLQKCRREILIKRETDPELQKINCVFDNIYSSSAEPSIKEFMTSILKRLN